MSNEILLWTTLVRSKVELGPSERYLGGVIRSLAVTVGLHLSLTVADLPCLQAWVVSLDLETSQQHFHHVMCSIFGFQSYFLIKQVISHFQHQIFTFKNTDLKAPQWMSETK